MRALAVVVMLAAAGHPSWANPVVENEADRLFREGRELFKAGSYAEACAKFQESDKIDPQAGTRFNLGLCNEKLGKLATASHVFEVLAREDQLVARRQKAAQWVKDLAPRIPRLVITVTPRDANEVVVKVDGVDVTDQAGLGIGIDLGPHDIEVTAGNYPAGERHIEIPDEAKTTRVEMALAPGTSTTVTTVPGTTLVTQSSRKGTGYIFLGSAGLVFAVGIWATVSAHSIWQDAQDACGGATCATTAMTEQANSLAGDARSRARVADVSFGVSALCVGLGIYFLAHTHSTVQHVAPVATPTSAGVSWSGQF